MAPRSRILRVQEVLAVLSEHLQRGAFYTQEDLLEAVSPHTDTESTLLVRVIDHAVEQGILGRTGKHYLLRRASDEQDFVDICKAEGLDLPAADPSNPGVHDLSKSIMNLPNLESKLLQLQHDVEHLKDAATTHWLSLSLAKMPRDIREELRRRAIQIVGTQAQPCEIERHMVHLAAQILVHALRAPKKPNSGVSS